MELCCHIASQFSTLPQYFVGGGVLHSTIGPYIMIKGIFVVFLSLQTSITTSLSTTLLLYAIQKVYLQKLNTTDLCYFLIVNTPASYLEGGGS
jgi:hypothetical protein